MDNARDAAAKKRELDVAKPEPPTELEITRSFLSIAYQYDHEAEDREADERAAKKWRVWLLILVVLLSFVFGKPSASSNWVSWSAHLGRLAIIGWLIVELWR